MLRWDHLKGTPPAHRRTLTALIRPAWRGWTTCASSPARLPRPHRASRVPSSCAGGPSSSGESASSLVPCV